MGAIPCPFAIAQLNDRRIFVCHFFITKMSKKRNASIFLLFIVAIVWGFGYMITDIALQASHAPSLINLIRFCLASILFGLIFFKKIKLTKTGLTWGTLCGVLLFLGFALQTEGLRHTTISNNAFFTSSNILFVPFIVWVFFKQKPSWVTLVGVAVAICGLLILNFGASLTTLDDAIESQYFWGNFLSLLSAFAFGCHMVMTSFCLRNKGIDNVQITCVELASTAVCFLIFFLFTDCSEQVLTQIDWSQFGWTVLFLAVLNTAFAYTGQIYAQQFVEPNTVSLILCTESMLGAIIPVLFGLEEFGWQMAVGGALVVLAIILVEYVSQVIAKKNEKQEDVFNEYDQTIE